MPALLVSGRWQQNAGPAGPVPGRTARVAVLVLTMAVAAVTATLVLPAASTWRNDDFRPFDRPPGGSAHS